MVPAEVPAEGRVAQAQKGARGEPRTEEESLIAPVVNLVFGAGIFATAGAVQAREGVLALGEEALGRVDAVLVCVGTGKDDLQVRRAPCVSGFAAVLLEEAGLP